MYLGASYDNMPARSGAPASHHDEGKCGRRDLAPWVGRTSTDNAFYDRYDEAVGRGRSRSATQGRTAGMNQALVFADASLWLEFASLVVTSPLAFTAPGKKDAAALILARAHAAARAEVKGNGARKGKGQKSLPRQGCSSTPSAVSAKPGVINSCSPWNGSPAPNQSLLPASISAAPGTCHRPCARSRFRAQEASWEDFL